MSTTNTTGAVGVSAAAATYVTFSQGQSYIEIAIAGATGGARVKKNALVVGDLNATTDSYITAGSSYRLQMAEPGKPITSIGIYANNSEADLVYSINKILTGAVV